MEATKATKREFTLPKKKVLVKPIQRPNPLTNDERAQFLIGRASITVTVPRLRNGKLVQVLTDEEKKFFEDPSKSQMEYHEGDLNVYRSTNNFWEDWSFKLGNTEIELDLSYPEDYITYKVLLFNTLLIAPSWEARNNKQTYMYALVDVEEQRVKRVTRNDSLAEAYSAYASIMTSTHKLANILRLITKKVVPYDTDIEFLKDEISNILAGPKGPERFLEAYHDPNAEEKLFILEATQTGALQYRGTAYYVPGKPEPIGYNWDEVVSWLKNPENQEMYLVLKQKVEDNS